MLTYVFAMEFESLIFKFTKVWTKSVESILKNIIFLSIREVIVVKSLRKNTICFPKTNIYIYGCLNICWKRVLVSLVFVGKRDITVNLKNFL